MILDERDNSEPHTFFPQGPVTAAASQPAGPAYQFNVSLYYYVTSERISDKKSSYMLNVKTGSGMWKSENWQEGTSTYHACAHAHTGAHTFVNTRLH